MNYSRNSEMGGGRGHGMAGGRGKNKGGSFGVGGYCVCAKCGERVKHQTGIKCTTIKCPKCAHTMVREELLSS